MLAVDSGGHGARCVSIAPMDLLELAPPATVRQQGRTGRSAACAGGRCGLAQQGAQSMRAGEQLAGACCTPASESSSATSALTHLAVVDRASTAETIAPL